MVFIISFACQILGSWSLYRAATPDVVAKLHLPLTWSLELTSEAGFIIALLASIFVGNLMPSLAEQFKEALQPAMYIKIAIVILDAELGAKKLSSML